MSATKGSTDFIPPRRDKEEAIWPGDFDSVIEAEKVAREHIRFYNHDYFHFSISYKSPVEFENKFEEKESGTKAA